MDQTKDLGTPARNSLQSRLFAVAQALRFAQALGLACAATLGTSILFRLVPVIDIETSRLFYADGHGFPATSIPILKFLRTLGLWSMDGAMAGVAVLTLLRCTLPERFQPARFYLIPPSLLIFLTTSAAIGPGLVTNVILKDHWGRARPILSNVFGGPQTFSLPWTMSDACHSNCSFVSGEGSGVFWLIAFVFVVPAIWRVPLFRFLRIWIVTISLNRIAFGGHYLSDVLIGWGLMLIVILICREIIIVWLGPKIDAWFERWQHRQIA
jgi:lipid A 4'-phosphatase